MKIPKKGNFLALDAAFALFLMVAAVAMISVFYIVDNPREQISYLSQDTISLLSSANIDQINNTYLNILIANGTIKDNKTSVLEQIGVLWVTGKKDIAQNLAANITSQFFSDDYGYSLVIGGEVLISSNIGNVTELATHKSLISGIQESKPIKGTSTRIYLSKVGSYTKSEYIYFGGFVGQGNVTVFTDNLPFDSNVLRMFLEIDSADNFTLFINGISCGNFLTDSQPMSADYHDIASCNSSLDLGGFNEFTFVFDSGFDTAYISGGFIRIDYYTDEIYTKDIDTGRYFFPEIDGIANVYSSFFVPGTLHSMKAYLHFKSNYTTYMSVGDRVVLDIEGDGTDQVFELGNDTLSSFPVMLDYGFISNSTVPVRFASFNSTLSVMTTSGNADVVIITDLSGSMKCRMGQWNCPPVGNSIPNCKDTDMDDPNSRRLGVAGCLDSQINDVIMNESLEPGNRLWLVDFSDDANPFYTNYLPDLTHSNIEEEIVKRYKSKSQNEIQGGTCIACSLNQAYQIFDSYSNESRQKYVIMMTDGIPTYCTGGYWSGFNWRCDEFSTGTTRQWPMWWQGISCYGDQSDCEVNDCLGPANNAINSARRLKSDLNVTVHAVGLGPIADCSMANYTVSKIAEAGNGSFILSDDANELAEFYKTIGIDIITANKLSSQTLINKGNLTYSRLYGDSYIEFNYTPVIEPVVHGEVPIFFQSENFGGCSHSFYVPDNIRIIDAKITSYSGPHWTDHVLLENMNGSFEVFNLSRYSVNYTRLGDPFIISMPSNYIQTGGLNNITIRTGDSPENMTDCSDNNTLIYTALINLVNASVIYESVYPYAVGCNLNIEHDTGRIMQVSVPYGYSGMKECNYTSGGYSIDDIDNDDSYDMAMYSFLSFLDYDDDGKVFVDFEKSDLIVNAKVVRDIPYLWGPTIVEVRVWK